MLHGDAAEHRNMPTDDAIKFIYKDFTMKTKRIVQSAYQHPDAVQTLLKTLVDNRPLTVLQYDHLNKYLTQRREVQRKAEIGEETGNFDYGMTPTTSTKSVQPLQASMPSSTSTQQDLQKKILEILNKKPLKTQMKESSFEVKPKKMTESEKDELKNKLMQDDKIKQAMMALRNSKRLGK